MNAEDWHINYTPISLVGLSVLCYFIIPCIFYSHPIANFQVFPYVSLSLLFLILAVVAALVLRFIVPEDLQRGHVIFSYLGLFAGFLWIWLLANHIIAIILVIAYITKLQPFYLGVIILGVGNSLGDLFSNMALAKLGFSKMALIGCIASPLFNTLIGLGISFAIYRLSGQKYVFNLNNLDTILTLFALVCLISYKVFTIGIVSKSK